MLTGPRRHRGDRLRDSPAPAGVGGIGAPGEGFTDPLVDCRTCKPALPGRSHAASWQCGRKPSKHPGETDECDPDRCTRFQPDVRNDRRAGQGVGLGGLSAPGDGAGHLHQLQERAASFSRKKPPFGIAQIGKSFRNEITPGNFIFRTREFEQMEMEFFVPPAPKREHWFKHWLSERERWYVEPGHPPRPSAAAGP